VATAETEGTSEQLAANLPGYDVRQIYSQVGDRFDAFEALRRQGPVIRQGMGVLTTTREAAETVFRNPDLYSSKFPPIGGGRPLIPIQFDPPEHKFYRKLFDPLFSPRAINTMEPFITTLVNEYIDAFEARGECVLDAELGVPLPTQVFLTFMGLPLSDTQLLLDLKNQVGLANERETTRHINEYFQAFVDERRSAPPRDDLMGQVLETEVDGHRLSDEEVLDACYLLLIAGLETITNSLSLFYYQLAQRSDLRMQIVADPDIIPSAVEELLRWETPTPAVPRVAAVDGDLCGVPVKAGDMVWVDLGAANTDLDFQSDAGELRLDRDPNPHYAFSGGIHRCSGSHLARLELRVTLREWHRRIPDYRVKSASELTWSPGLRGIENLVLEWEQ
jgi:cytochrome P450